MREEQGTGRENERGRETEKEGDRDRDSPLLYAICLCCVCLCMQVDGGRVWGGGRVDAHKVMRMFCDGSSVITLFISAGS